MFQFYLFLLSFFTPISGVSQVHEISLEQLKANTIHANDTLYIVNFWATWCKPCVAEMPYFEEANRKFSNQKVKVVFVSLNYARELLMVDKFVKQKKIRSQCYLLNAGNPNNWIDKIEKEWSGSIPATIMFKGGKKKFFREGEFIQTELDSIIQTKIQ